MNIQGNTYTFIYSSVMVIVVAAALAFTAIQLQPYQENNIKVEKMQNILASVGEVTTPENAETKYKEIIVKEFIINEKGETIEGNAFNVDLKNEMKKKVEERKFPIYQALKDGKNYFVIPLRGKGLWGPIWGYVSLEEDLNTIHGAVFDHKGETPGLGAEISTAEFRNQFIGKKIFKADTVASIKVYKGGKNAAINAGDTEYGVDAVSGGTITSKGLEAMMLTNLSDYENYFKNNKK